MMIRSSLNQVQKRVLRGPAPVFSFMRGGEIMPNIKSAKKRVKVNEVKTMQNKAVRSDLRTAIKKAELSLEAGAENKAEAVRFAIKKIDGAVTKGILHKNCAARKKSSLQLKLNRVG